MVVMVGDGCGDGGGDYGGVEVTAVAAMAREGALCSY